MSLVIAILGLGFLIVVHEAGHFTVARWCKMRVERFSIGFGPPLIKWKPGATQFQIAPIPFGGFVQITGMNPHEDYEASDPHVYPNRPTWQRFLTILAGPATNYVAAIVLIFAVYSTVGARTYSLLVSEVSAGKAADGKLKPGDRIVSVDGVPVSNGRRDRFIEAVQRSHGQPITLGVQRDGQPIEIQVTPRLAEAGAPGAAERRWRIGISYMPFEPTGSREHLGVGAAAGWAAAYPVEKSRDILVGLYKIIRREVPGDVLGPPRIVKVIRDEVRRGWADAFEIIALLSVYLGLFNLLPLPALDGGRLAFLGYEMATRRRPNPRVETIVHTVGFVALALLMLLVVIRDIRSFFS